MRIVTGFSESFEEPDKKPSNPLTDYIQTIEAIEHSHEVTENAFARAAKKTLRDRLPEATLAKSNDEELVGLSLWVTENSIVFDLLEKENYVGVWEDIRQRWAEELHDLIDRLADGIEKTSNPEGQLILVDALKIRMLQVGPHLYRFSVKQMWTVKKDG